MTVKKEKETKDRPHRQMLFLSNAIEDQSWREELTKEDKKADFIIWKLKRMKITEIVVKFMAFTWAFIWTGFSLGFLLFKGNWLMMMLTALPAIGFWVILARSAGSVEAINMEIRELKKEMLVKSKK